MGRVEITTVGGTTTAQSTRTGDERVAAYCRVSTLNEEQELSYQTQCDYYQTLISSQDGKDLVGIYGDHGISGLHMRNRGGLQNLLDDCRKGLIDTVMTKVHFMRNILSHVGQTQKRRFAERLKQIWLQPEKRDAVAYALSLEAEYRHELDRLLPDRTVSLNWTHIFKEYSWLLFLPDTC